jgi:hypothetical protein
MRYLFLLLTLFLFGCASQKSTIGDNEKSFLNADSSMVYVPVDSTINDKDFTEPLVAAMERPQPQKETIIKEVVKNTNSTTNVNSQSDLGQVIYKVPDTMQVMKNYDIIVRISRSNTNVEISQNLNGKVITKSIKTSHTMQVELVDPTGECFKILEVNSQKQMVDSSYTEWRFNVTPIKSGNNKLNLVVSIFKNDDVKQTVYSDEIYVQANAPAQIKSFWYENWKWSMEKIIIPILAWLFGRWWGKRSEKKKRRY